MRTFLNNYANAPMNAVLPFMLTTRKHSHTNAVNLTSNTL